MRARARVSGRGSRCLFFIIILFPRWVYGFRFCFCIVYISVVEIGRISVAIGWTIGCAIAWVNAWGIRIVTGIVADFGGISGAISCAVSTDFTRIVTLNSAFSVANGEVMQAVRGRRALLFAFSFLRNLFYLIQHQKVTQMRH